MNVFIDIDIDIDIFKSDLIDIDIDIFKTCRYIDNRYGLSIYRTPLLVIFQTFDQRTEETLPYQPEETKSLERPKKLLILEICGLWWKGKLCNLGGAQYPNLSTFKSCWDVRRKATITVMVMMMAL